jgi:excisionase family DNA binding protein
MKDNQKQQAVIEQLSEIKTLLKKNDDHAYRQTSKPMTFKEACAYLGFAPSYLYKLTSKQLIPHYKPTGKVLFFSKAEIDEWIYTNAECRAKNAELKSENTSNTLGTKDPNQVELFNKEKARSNEKNEKDEIVIGLPLKSRRKK